MGFGFWVKKKGTRIARIIHEFLCCKVLHEFYLQMGFGFWVLQKRGHELHEFYLQMADFIV